jgi:lipopolysaccharide export system ATP-binding protein
MAAILDKADDSGSVSFRDLAVAYREEYLEAQRIEFGEAGRQSGALSVDEVRRHLETSVLPRIAELLQPLPEQLDDADVVRVSPTLWIELGPVSETERRELVELAVEEVRAAEDGLVKTYRRRRVVDQVRVEVQQGEIVGLLGPNGAGKTTTFYMMVGLVRPEEGRIHLDGEDISALPMYQRARRGIGYLAQEPSIFRKLTAEDNVMAILETLPITQEERARRLESLLDDLSLKHLRDVKAFKLSGGERRRLEITRALVTEPKFLLLDEPFTGVDPIAVADIQTIVAGLRRRGIGVLITDHNVEQTLDIVDRAYIMFEGKVQVSGTVRQLVFDDQVADLYLGPTLTARLRERLGTRV